MILIAFGMRVCDLDPNHDDFPQDVRVDYAFPRGLRICFHRHPLPCGGPLASHADGQVA